MQFYLETLKADEFMEINQAISLAGVYTRPMDFISETADVEKTLESLLEYMSAEQKIFVYPVTGNFRTMLEEGKNLQKISSQITLTLPASDQGYMAAKVSKRMNLPVAIGALYQSEQAAIALQDSNVLLFYDLEEAGNYGDSLAVLKAILSLLDDEHKESLVVICPNLEMVRKALNAGARAICTRGEVYSRMLFNPMTTSLMNKAREEWMMTYTRSLVVD